MASRWPAAASMSGSKPFLGKAHGHKKAQGMLPLVPSSAPGRTYACMHACVQAGADAEEHSRPESCEQAACMQPCSVHACMRAGARACSLSDAMEKR